MREQGYGLAMWPSAMKILRDELGVADLDLWTSQSMAIIRKNMNKKLEIRPPVESDDKGFMKRSSLLKCLLNRVEELHPGCILTNHRCLRVAFGDDEVTAIYETNGIIASYSCDLLVGADGVNSTVRKYVSLKFDSRSYGHMTAYRFLVQSPSEHVLKQTETTWNMSISDSIHSPSYHVSKEDNCLNIVVLEFDGKPPGRPRQATLSELEDVVRRSEICFIANILKTERISDLMCYSTFHVDCEPWHRPHAVIIGDAAHAYGPLTAKMANLAINDAHTLATILNMQNKTMISQVEALEEWESIQRPKFEVTRMRTLRHLQLYAPRMRCISTFLGRHFPKTMFAYFASIFSYDYVIHGSIPSEVSGKSIQPFGIVGAEGADPLVVFVKRGLKHFVLYLGTLLLLLCVAHNTQDI